MPHIRRRSRCDSVSLSRDPVHAPLENDDHSLGQREVSSQLRKLLQQREVLLAAETDHGLRQLRIGLVFGVGPYIVDEIERLAARATDRIAAGFLYQIQRLLLIARLST